MGGPADCDRGGRGAAPRGESPHLQLRALGQADKIWTRATPPRLWGPTSSTKLQIGPRAKILEEIDVDRFNVAGGSIAHGYPFAATAAARRSLCSKCWPDTAGSPG